MASEYKQDRWNTTPFDPTRCKASVSDGGRWPRYHQCKRVPWQDGWCQQHHPDTRAQRIERTLQRYERRLESNPVHQLGLAQERIAKLETQRDDLLAACEVLLKHFENDAEALDLYIDNWPAVKAARAAIAKVRGEG